MVWWWFSGLGCYGWFGGGDGWLCGGLGWSKVVKGGWVAV